MITEDARLTAGSSQSSSGLSARARSESFDDKLFASMRCVLAFAALAIVYIDPLMPQQMVGANYGMLAAYCVFALLVAVDAFTRRRLPWRDRLHWGDVLFGSFLMYLSEATSSVFFFTYLFAILVGSFSQGYREGVRVLVASLALFLLIGILPAPQPSELELDRALLRPVYLLALGYMIALWGGRQLLLKRELLLLKEANTFDPRYGVEHALQANFARLLAFYSAERCVLALHQGEESDAWVMYTLSPQEAADLRVHPLTAEAARTLLCLDDRHSIIYDETQPERHRLVCLPRAAGEGARDSAAPPPQACAVVAGLLEAPRFASVPCCEGDAGRGRLFVAGATSRFGTSDLDFLLQYVETIATIVNNIRLLEELVREAAAHERIQISRNLHDTTIQPYIGLRLALEALQRDASPDNPLAQKIARLVEQANITVNDLRSYTTVLRDGGNVPAGSFTSTLESVAERYRRFYGIEVHLNVDMQPDCQGRLAEDAFYIVLEGLSNVLKHTTARTARVGIGVDGALSITISSEGGEKREAAATFSPRSITARAHELGGSVHAEERPDGSSVLIVRLPLTAERQRGA